MAQQRYINEANKKLSKAIGRNARISDYDAVRDFAGKYKINIAGLKPNQILKKLEKERGIQILPSTLQRKAEREATQKVKKQLLSANLKAPTYSGMPETKVVTQSGMTSKEIFKEQAKKRGEKARLQTIYGKELGKKVAQGVYSEAQAQKLKDIAMTASRFNLASKNEIQRFKQGLSTTLKGYDGKILGVLPRPNPIVQYQYTNIYTPTKTAQQIRERALKIVNRSVSKGQAVSDQILRLARVKKEDYKDALKTARENKGVKIREWFIGDKSIGTIYSGKEAIDRALGKKPKTFAEERADRLQSTLKAMGHKNIKRSGNTVKYTDKKTGKRIAIGQSDIIKTTSKTAKLTPSLVRAMNKDIIRNIQKEFKEGIKSGDWTKIYPRLGVVATTGRVTEKKIKELEALKKKYRGSITEFKPKSIREKLAFETEKNIQIREANKTGVEEKVFRGVFISAILGGIRGTVGALQTIANPIKYAKQQLEAIKTPRKTLSYLGQQFIIDPVGVVAEFYTFGKTLKVAGYGVKRSPVGRFVREELYIRSQPNAIRPYIRSIIKSAKIQEKINPNKVKAIKKVDFLEVKSLTRTEARALKKALQNTDSVVFGSLASRTLSRKKTPLPKDVDLATANITKFYKEFVKGLPKKIKNNYILKGGKIVRKSNKEALFDIKPLSRLYPAKIPFFRKGFLPVSGFIKKIKKTKKGYLPKKQAGVSRFDVPTQKKVTIDGIKLVGFGEQTTRKALGTIQVLIEKNVRRAKDPQSFIVGLKVQLYGLKALKPKNVIAKAWINRKIKILKEALKVLESKDFIKILDSKVKGLSKEYPLLTKISKNKLKRAKKKTTTKRAKKEVKKLTTKQILKQIPKKIQKNVSILPSKLPKGAKASIIPSRLPRSRIPRSKISRSKIPRSKVPRSKIPRSKVPRSKIPRSKIPRSKVPRSKIPRSKIPKIKKLTWSSKIPKGYVPVVKGYVRVKGINKKIIESTPNRAYKKILPLIDKTLSRSFQLNIVGIKRGKDIKTPVSLRKFRIKRSRNSKVLNLVEKSRHALDTRGEKARITLARRLAKNRRKRK